MADSDKNAVPRFEKRGGYSGGRPASTVGPPPTTPSGSVAPAAAPKPKKKTA